MPSFEALLKEKNKRLEAIPLAMQTVAEKQQKKVLEGVLNKLSQLELKNGQIKISSKNIKAIADISDELKAVLLNDEYLKAVKEFAKEFELQATINGKLIKAGFGETESPIAAEEYIETAKRSAVNSLIGSKVDDLMKPIADSVTQSVISGASLNEAIDAANIAASGNSEIAKYVKSTTYTAFGVADRSYTSIVSDYLGNEWFYYAGSEVEKTRCFCKERVGKYFHYKEIESWANGENLGDCDIGGGKWAGEIAGTNSATIYSYLGGWFCMHSLVPVSEAIVPDIDIARAKLLGFID